MGSGGGVVCDTATLAVPTSNSKVPVAIDGGVVVQFGTRPRRRRQQQSFGSI